MAAPNIVGVKNIIGVTSAISLTTTPQVVVSNQSSSNKVYKINTIIASNVDGSASANVFVRLNDSATGAGTSTGLAHEIPVAADSTLVILEKGASIYLQENRSITAWASASGDIDITCSYEEITDQ